MHLWDTSPPHCVGHFGTDECSPSPAAFAPHSPRTLVRPCSDDSSVSGRRRRACALASVRRSNCTDGFPVCSFHDDCFRAAVYALRHALRHAAQNSGPSGSLLLPSREDLSSFASCRFIPAHNCLSFHQHNGKLLVTTFVFINIMERPVSDIFTPFVFNNIMEDTFIFPPRVFPRHTGQE